MSKSQNKRVKPAVKGTLPKSGAASPAWMKFAAVGMGVVLIGMVAFAALEPIQRMLGYAPKDIFSVNEDDYIDESKPPKVNDAAPPRAIPDGMVWIPGGDFNMGTEEPWGVSPQHIDTAPVHRVLVNGFFMDKTEVTNKQYAAFVKATGYVTVAEQQPDPREFIVDGQPIDPSKLKPFSLYFNAKQPGKVAELSNPDSWWEIRYGASWRHPEGPGSTIEGKDNYPVVHVCYEDCEAYCKWAGKRLPTEAEWEFASRGGMDRKPYLWGDEKTPGGKFMANYWQGNFPQENTKDDGFEGLAPVGSYPPNGFGLFDMSGNVWEWCADFYQPNYYVSSPQKNPKGPDFGFDPDHRDSARRVQRGGSYLCADNYCVRYVAGARGKGDPKSATNHIGFRCVMDAK